MSKVVPALAVAALFIVAACGDGDSNNSQPTSPPAAGTPTPGAKLDEDLERVLSVLFSGDEDAVRELVRFSSVPCAAEPVGIGAPPQCPDGVADGSDVDAFPFANCEGFYTLAEDFSAQVFAQPGPELVAVYEGGVGDDFLAGEYVAVFLGGRNPRQAHIAQAVWIDGGAIVGHHSVCAMTPDAFAGFFQLGTPILVAQRSAPPDGRTGLPVVDAILDTLEAGDLDELRLFVRYTGIACVTEGALGGPPVCREGEQGTLVEVLPIRTCELEYHRRGEIDWALQDLIDNTEVYGVYENAGGYAIVLTRTIDIMRLGAALSIVDTDVVEIKFSCGETPEELVELLELGDPVLPPEG